MRDALRALMPLLLLPLLAGCATLGLSAGPSDPFTDLRQFVRVDVAQALALASKAQDAGAPYRARCYTTLLRHLPEPGPAASAPEVKGLVSAFEIAAETVAQVRTGGLLRVPEDLQADCGYIKDEILRAGARGWIKSIIPGGGIILR